jgi:hypothetical protein
MRTERSRGSDEKASDDGEGFGGDASDSSQNQGALGSDVAKR